MARLTPRQRDIGAALASSILCFAAAGLGGWATATSVDGWYQTLAKPAFTPPDWVFAPAWNLLFLLMVIALWRVWRRSSPGPSRRLALALFVVQLVLNVGWSVVFFAWQRVGWALVEIAVLAVVIIATLWAFARLDRWAAGLLVPYALWVGFAIALNTGIVVLNGPAP